MPTACVSLTCGLRRSHAVTWTASDGWLCTCPALRRCAHVLALQSVTARSRSA